MQLIDAERERVPGVRVMDFAKLMGIRKQRMARMLGVLESTSAREPAAGELLTRSEGWAALGMARLLGIAKEIVDESTAPAAKGFDSAKWLGRWLEQPQPALGGRKPSELIDTPTGFDVVARLLGSMASGAYS